MVFLNPLFLWTLLGLTVPIAIHFWSKKKVKTIKIGSTQLLRELNPVQTSSIWLNEWFLLLLRMLIITLLALILSAPGIEILKKEKSITYLVEPSLLGTDKVNTILDSIADSQVRILAKGFPLLEEMDTESRQKESINYWQLARQMEALQTDSIIVLTKGLLAGIKGMRPRLSVPVHWLVIDDGQSSFSPVQAVLSGDQLLLTSVKSGPHVLDYKHETYALSNDNITIDNEQDSVLITYDNKAVKLPLYKVKTQQVLIVYQDGFSSETTYISAAFTALSNYLKQDIQITKTKEIQGMDLSSFDVLVWLSKDVIAPFSGKILQWQPDDLAHSLVEPGASNDLYLLRHHLDAENSIDLNLPEQLIGLSDLYEQVPNHLQALDQRVIDQQELQVNKLPGTLEKNPREFMDISHWLWIILFLLIPVERILSKYWKQ